MPQTLRRALFLLLLIAPSLTGGAARADYIVGRGSPATVPLVPGSCLYVAQFVTLDLYIDRDLCENYAAALGITEQAPAGADGDIQLRASATALGALTPGAGVTTWIGTPSSANLRATLTDETGTGAAVFGTAPTLTDLTLGDVTGEVQCLHVDVSGTVSGAGADCGTRYAVPSVAALKAFPGSVDNAMWRLGVEVAGDAGPAFLYLWTEAACSLNSGAGDDGWQVEATAGGCWVAQLGGETDLRLWGAPGSADDSAILTRANTALNVGLKTTLGCYAQFNVMSIDFNASNMAIRGNGANCIFNVTDAATLSTDLMKYSGDGSFLCEYCNFTAPLWFETDDTGVTSPPGRNLFAVNSGNPSGIVLRHSKFRGGGRHLNFARGFNYTLDDVISDLSWSYATTLDASGADADHRGEVNVEVNRLQVYSPGKYGISMLTNSGATTQASTKIRVKNSKIHGSGMTDPFFSAKGCFDITGTSGDYIDVDLDVYDCGKGGGEAKATLASRAASGPPGPLNGMMRINVNGRTVVDSGSAMMLVVWGDGNAVDPGPEIRKMMQSEIWASYGPAPDCLPFTDYDKVETCTVAFGTARHVYMAMTAGKTGDLSTFIPPTEASFTGTLDPVADSLSGSISGTTLTVTAPGTAPLGVGATLSGVGGGGVHVNTKVLAQLSGTTGGVGTYKLNFSQTVTSTSINYTYGLLTVTAISSGEMARNQWISGLGALSGTHLKSFGTGTGGIGTYFIDRPQTLSSRDFTALNTSNFVEDGGTIWWHYLGTEPPNKGMLEARPEGGVTGDDYVSGDWLTADGGDCAKQPILRPTGIIGGKITALIIKDTGTCATPPTNPITLSGGSGTGAQIHAQFSPIATLTSAARVYGGTDMEVHVHAQRMAKGLWFAPQGSDDQTIWRGDYSVDGTVWGDCMRDAVAGSWGTQQARIVDAKVRINCRSLGSQAQSADAAVSLGYTHEIPAWQTGPAASDDCPEIVTASGCWYRGDHAKNDSGKTYVVARCLNAPFPCASASTGGGPTGEGTNIADGDVVWNYMGTHDVVGVQWDNLQISGNIERQSVGPVFNFNNSIYPITMNIAGGTILTGADSIFENYGTPVTAVIGAGTQLAVTGKQTPLHSPFFSRDGSTGSYTSLGPIGVKTNAAVGSVANQLWTNGAGFPTTEYFLQAIRGYSDTAPMFTSCARGDWYTSRVGPPWFCATPSTTAGTWSDGTLALLQSDNSWTGSNTFALVSGARNAQTGTTYTLLEADCGKKLKITNASAITLTVPDNIARTCDVAVKQGGAGQITVVASGTATLDSANTFTKTFGINAEIILSNDGATLANWNLSGNGAHLMPRGGPRQPTDLAAKDNWLIEQRRRA